MFKLNDENIITYEGSITEKIPQDTFLKEFVQIVESQAGDSKAVDLTFEEATHINSLGVKTLLHAMNNCPVPVNLIRNPVWLVDQFKMIHGFFGDKHIATSFYFPYFNDDQGLEFTKLLHVKEDFDLSKDFGSQNFGAITKDNLSYEPDEDPGQYFSFLLPIEDRIRNYISNQ